MSDSFEATRSDPYHGALIERTVERLCGPNGARTVTETTARQVVASVVHEARLRGAQEALGALLSTDDVAARTGLMPRTVRLVAAREGIGARFGRDWVFQPEDVARFPRRSRGRPRSRPTSEQS